MHNSMPEESLRDLWGKVEPGTPPSPVMVEEARRLGRRRRLGFTAAAFSAAVATTFGVVALQDGLGDDEGAPQASISEASERPVVHPNVIRGSISFDYEGFKNISEAVDQAPLVFAGRVVGWTDGRAVQDATDVSLYSVLKIRVTDSIKVPDVVRSNFIYVEVPRGGYVLDENGKEFRNPGAPLAYRSIDEMGKAVPAGVRVIVIGGLAASDAQIQAAGNGIRLLGAGKGHPVDAPLVALHPQGLLFETHTGGAVSGLEHGTPAEWGWLPSDTATTQMFESLLSQAKS